MLSAENWARLETVLGEAKRRGDLGPPPVGAHVEHALAMAACVGQSPRSFLDLGSGGGVPALVLLLVWPEARAVLLEVRAARASRLVRALAELGVASRAEVVVERAEVAARDPRHRERFDLVTARAFGGPAVTAECATGFVAVSGRLVVSEPPGGCPERWPPAGLARLGFGPASACARGGATFVVVRKEVPADDRWPRRVGVPARRPLWNVGASS